MGLRAEEPGPDRARTVHVRGGAQRGADGDVLRGVERRPDDRGAAEPDVAVVVRRVRAPPHPGRVPVHGPVGVGVGCPEHDSKLLTFTYYVRSL